METAVVETDPTPHFITAIRKSIFSVFKVSCELPTVEEDNWWYFFRHRFCSTTTECSVLVSLGSHTPRRHSGVIMVLCIIKLLGGRNGCILVAPGYNEWLAVFSTPADVSWASLLVEKYTTRR